jgi:hypothetical protein
MIHNYLNPWAGPSEPKEYSRNVNPIEYNGCQIFRVHQTQFDVVKAGVCISQRGGLEGAKKCADAVSDLMFPSFHDVRSRMLETYGYI